MPREGVMEAKMLVKKLNSLIQTRYPDEVHYEWKSIVTFLNILDVSDDIQELNYIEFHIRQCLNKIFRLSEPDVDKETEVEIARAGLVKVIRQTIKSASKGSFTYKAPPAPVRVIGPPVRIDVSTLPFQQNVYGGGGACGKPYNYEEIEDNPTRKVFIEELKLKAKPIIYSHGRIYNRGIGVVLPYGPKAFKYITQITQKNLEEVAKKASVKWNKVYIFLIKQRPHYTYYPGRRTSRPEATLTRLSILVEGKNKKGYILQFWRKETAGAAAGQTLLYVEGKNPVKVSDLLNYQNYKKFYERHPVQNPLTPDETNVVEGFNEESGRYLRESDDFLQIARHAGQQEAYHKVIDRFGSKSEQNPVIGENYILTPQQEASKTRIIQRRGREPDEEFYNHLLKVYFVRYGQMLIGIETDGEAHT